MNRGVTGRSFRNEAASDFFGAWWRPVGVNARRPGSTKRKGGFLNIASYVLDSFVRWLDGFMRRRQGIIDFTDDPQCILRLNARPAHGGELLPGGRRALKGEMIGEFHLWNEHLPQMPPGGADIVWGTTMRRRLRRSLVMMAAFVQSDPRFAGLTAFCGETAFARGKSLEQTHGMAKFFGFEILENRRPAGFLGWWARLGEAIYLWGMVHAFNRNALKTQSLMNPVWFQFWITRETLLKKYGAVHVPEERFQSGPEATGQRGCRAA